MKAFISYSHRDEALLQRLHAHLAMLRREGGISEWYDREIKAGGAIDREISTQLDGCQLFLALVSPDFLNSGYCYDKEMMRAVERHEAGELTIVPIVLEPCDWQASPLKQFKAVPKDGKPISEWTNQNTAFLDVVTELRRLVTSNPAEGKRPATVPPENPGQRKQAKYRLKRSFDQIDRSDFRKAAYRTIREYFERNVAEINSVDGIRARNEDIGPLAFTCIVLNRLMRREGQAAFTIRAASTRSGYGALGDLYYSFQEHAPENTANGGFNVESDEYELFLKRTNFDSQERDRRWSPDEAAHRLWEELLENAGISYG
jgi:hypothetical protein